MIDMTNFKKSVKWYDENLATLLPQYRGKYVGVCIDKVCGLWDDQDVGFGVTTIYVVPTEGAKQEFFKLEAR